MFKRTIHSGEGQANRQPSNWQAIAYGLEKEASRALNAVPLHAVVTLKNGELLVNGRYSQSLNAYAQHTCIDDTLDMLVSNGRAVTVNRYSPF